MKNEGNFLNIQETTTLDQDVFDVVLSPDDTPRSPKESVSSEVEALLIDQSLTPSVRKSLEIIFSKVKDLEKLALIDQLTGLPNRREFIDRLKWLFDLNDRSKESETQDFSIIAFDLDGFKAINDTFGHDAGDRCLQLVAEEVKHVIRKTDLFAREGGDEFSILLPKTKTKDAYDVAEKVFKAIDVKVTERLRELYPEIVGVSASVGVVSYDKSGDKKITLSQNSFLKRADYVRYVVKAAGKKGILSYEEAISEYDTDRQLQRAFLSGEKLLES